MKFLKKINQDTPAMGNWMVLIGTIITLFGGEIQNFSGISPDEQSTLLNEGAKIVGSFFVIAGIFRTRQK